MVSGFGLCGNPEALIAGVLEHGAKDLTLISNNAGNLGKGLNTWLEAGIVAKFVGSYIGSNEALHEAMAAGRLEVDIVPQGTFSERIRAAGAGIPAFYTPTGAGTVVAEGKEVREFHGRPHLLEHALSADLAFVRAHRSDPYGNLRFWKTARNFAPLMATAARHTIVECDELVPLGRIEPDNVHLPGLFVESIIEVADHDDPIEHRTVREAQA